MLKALKRENRRESFVSIPDEEKQKRIQKLRKLASGNFAHVIALEIFFVYTFLYLIVKTHQNTIQKYETTICI